MPNPKSAPAPLPPLKFHPLTAGRWSDFVRLFGRHGACGGCWCMWWRETQAEFEKKQGDGNRRAMRRIVGSGAATGILGYAAGEPAGWISIAPREDFSRLENSRTLKRIDNRKAWSIVCFYVGKEYRGKGIALPLIRAAVAFAKRRGAKMVEAYPSIPEKRRVAPASVYMGIRSVFARAGFVECARPSDRKIVMRYTIKRRPSGTKRTAC
jgi:GNAT superfamily N-acetyltransferase